MSELENTQDRIDEYIRGTMSDKNRAIFEEELRRNADLRHEVGVQISIADAVQAAHLKHVFQDIETEFVQNESKTNAPIFRWRHVYQWGFAFAVLAVLFFFGNNWRLMRRTITIGNEYYANIIVPSSRGGDATDSLLALSYSLIGEAQFDAAEGVLAQLEAVIDEGLQRPLVDEETKYTHDVLEIKKYDLEWYRTISLLKQGKYREAKKRLVAISRSQSPYALEARTIIEDLFNIKP